MAATLEQWRKSGLTGAAFCRPERLSVSLWKYWQRQVERLTPQEGIRRRRRLHTANGLERLNKEIKQRTRVATLFPHAASLLRLASAVLSEISDQRGLGNRTFLPEHGSQVTCLLMPELTRRGVALSMGMGGFRSQ